jgi:glycerate 2-kinase
MPSYKLRNNLTSQLSSNTFAVSRSHSNNDPRGKKSNNHWRLFDMALVKISRPNTTREKVLAILQEGLNAADPKRAVQRAVQVKDDKIFFEEPDGNGATMYDLSKGGNIYVVGAGKASGAMAEALEEILSPDRITKGLVNILKDTKDNFNLNKIELNEADHPIPDEGGVKGAKEIRQIAGGAKQDDLVICLISGGGSAMMPLPPEQIPLVDKGWLTKRILKVGADIKEINVIRKHISMIKGGQLAEAAFPAKVVSLILSDVVGDDVSSIASGPTAPDPSTYQDAKRILEKYSLWSDPKFPTSMMNYIQQQIEQKQEAAQNHNAGEIHNLIIGSNLISLLAMQKKAKEEMKNAFVMILTSYLEGEAKDMGRFFGGIARAIHQGTIEIHRRPFVLLAGGETTVTVTGNGKGGRNQELILSAARSFSSEMSGIVIAAMASDGKEAFTDAAGAIMDSTTVQRAKAMGLDPGSYLLNNDSNSFFKKLEDLLVTDPFPSGTNVNDFIVLLVV